ncbi:MAG: alpha/beta hydrolase fold domain-containing protein [Brevefilum sp.]|jgi:acetyl esterase/lipase
MMNKPIIGKAMWIELAPPSIMDVSYIFRKWLDVPYGTQSAAQRVDIYLPNEGEGPFPVILAIHGGAWMKGDKRSEEIFPALCGLERGYAVVAVEYRLSYEAIFPAQIYDCKTAVRFIHAHAEKYKLNTDRIAAWGSSAGAHLGALLGTSAGVEALEDLSMGWGDYSSRVHAVVSWYGPNENFLTMDEQLSASESGVPDHSQAESPESLLLGAKITDVPERVEFASPMTYITEDIPDFLLQHGTLDQLVPVEQSINFAHRIEEVAGKEKVILEILEDSIHADVAFFSEDNIARVYTFLDERFKPG